MPQLVLPPQYSQRILLASCMMTSSVVSAWINNCPDNCALAFLVVSSPAAAQSCPTKSNAFAALADPSVYDKGVRPGRANYSDPDPPPDVQVCFTSHPSHAASMTAPMRC